MSEAKRDRWTEGEIDALPAGEHDYFERKGGDLFQDLGRLKGSLAKALSAFANSGGGHLVLGVRDDQTPDGVPPRVGGTATRDWLEQVIPHLLAYPLSDFRVHLVERAAISRIPPEREVVVVDVGDSPLAPHQCATGAGEAKAHLYYHRQAGRSVPAPHFYLELLRQRLVGPTLTATPQPVQFSLDLYDDQRWLNLAIPFELKNRGRVAAYHWKLIATLSWERGTSLQTEDFGPSRLTRTRSEHL